VSTHTHLPRAQDCRSPARAAYCQCLQRKAGRFSVQAEHRLFRQLIFASTLQNRAPTEVLQEIPRSSNHKPVSMASVARLDRCAESG